MPVPWRFLVFCILLCYAATFGLVIGWWSRLGFFVVYFAPALTVRVRVYLAFGFSSSNSVTYFVWCCVWHCSGGAGSRISAQPEVRPFPHAGQQQQARCTFWRPVNLRRNETRGDRSPGVYACGRRVGEICCLLFRFGGTGFERAFLKGDGKSTEKTREVQKPCGVGGGRPVNCASPSV